MVSEKFIGLLVSLLVLLVVPLGVKSEACSGIAMTYAPPSTILGSTPKTIQVGIKGLVHPTNPWGNYTNGTISFPGTGVLNLSQPFVDLTALGTTGSYDWSFNLTASGSHNFSVDIQNTTSTCNLDLVYNSTAVTDPSLALSNTDLTETKANLDTSFSVTLNNSGLGDAVNLTIKVESNVFSEIEKSVANVSANTILTVPLTFSPTQCLSTDLKVDVSYKNQAGEDFTLPRATDAFVVNGSDLVIDQFNLSSSSVSEGSQVTLSVSINNTGQKTSDGFNVTFYKDSVLSANKIAEIISSDSIGLLERKGVSTTWSTSGAGTHDIIAVAKSASGECNTANSQNKTSLSIIAQGSSTSPSGGSSTTDAPNPLPSTPLATPTPTSQNPAVQESELLGSILAGETKSADFTNSDKLNIEQVSISVKNDVSGATVNVKKEGSKPESVTLPPGEVYGYLTITTNVKKEDISSAKLSFKLEKSWIESNSIDKNKVALNRFTSQWDKLATTLLKEDEKFVYFSAETPGFSVFSITGEKTLPSITPTQQPSSSPTASPVTGGGGPSGLFLGGTGNLSILVIIVIAAAVIFFLYKKKK